MSKNKINALDLKDQGNAALKAKNPQLAIQLYSQAIALFANEPTFFTNRAAVFLELGKFEKAKQDCQDALKLDSKNIKAHYRLGLAFTNLKQNANAVKHLEIAQTLDPNNAAIREALGKVKLLPDMPPEFSKLFAENSAILQSFAGEKLQAHASAIDMGMDLFKMCFGQITNLQSFQEFLRAQNGKDLLAMHASGSKSFSKFASVTSQEQSKQSVQTLQSMLRDNVEKLCGFLDGMQFAIEYEKISGVTLGTMLANPFALMQNQEQYAKLKQVQEVYMSAMDPYAFIKFVQELGQFLADAISKWQN